jgi:hypothetical protein
MSNNSKPTQQPKPLTEEKGRTIPRPPQIKPKEKNKYEK